MTRSWVEVGWSWPSARRQVSTRASASRCSLVRSSTGTGSPSGWSWWSRRKSSSLTRWRWVRTAWPHSGSSSPAIWVMPSRFFQARSRFLAFIRSHSLRPSSSECRLMNCCQPTPELEGRLTGASREQLRFVLIQGGPSRRVGFGSGMGHDLGVLVGDGPVLEGVLGLGQLTELGGGLGPPFGLPRPAVLFAVQPVGGVLGRVRRVGVSRSRQDPEQAGFAAGGPGPQPFGRGRVASSSSTRVRASGSLPQEGHGCVRIEHQY